VSLIAVELPSGKSIQAKGITPDIIVEEPGANPLIRVREADLQRHLSNGQDKDLEKPSTPRTPTQPAAQGEAPKPIELGSKDDFQLTQALSHLKGLPVLTKPPATVAEAKKEKGG